MSSKFEALLVDLSRQVSAAERLLQSSAQREQEIVRELGVLREKVAALQKGEEWSGEERRKVDARLGTGDHTLERLKFEVKSAEGAAERAIKAAEDSKRLASSVLGKVEDIRKSIEKTVVRASSRKWALIKMIVPPLIAAICGVLSAMAASRFSYDGKPKPPEEKVMKGTHQ